MKKDENVSSNQILKEGGTPTRKKFRTALFFTFWTLLLFAVGMASGAYMYHTRLLEEGHWAIDNPKEARWAMNRQKLIQKAAEMLYFEDTNEGMTIIKSYTKNIE